MKPALPDLPRPRTRGRFGQLNKHHRLMRRYYQNGGRMEVAEIVGRINNPTKDANATHDPL